MNAQRFILYYICTWYIILCLSAVCLGIFIAIIYDKFHNKKHPRN